MRTVDYGGINVTRMGGPRDMGQVSIYRHVNGAQSDDVVLDDTGVHLEHVYGLHYEPTVLPNNTTSYDFNGSHTQIVTFDNAGSQAPVFAATNIAAGAEIRLIIHNRRTTGTSNSRVRYSFPTGWSSTQDSVTINMGQTRVITLIATSASTVVIGV